MDEDHAHLSICFFPPSDPIGVVCSVFEIIDFALSPSSSFILINHLPERAREKMNWRHNSLTRKRERESEALYFLFLCLFPRQRKIWSENERKHWWYINRARTPLNDCFAHFIQQLIAVQNTMMSTLIVPLVFAVICLVGTMAEEDKVSARKVSLIDEVLRRRMICLCFRNEHSIRSLVRISLKK